MSVELERHPSLDDRFDPAIRIVEYDAAWPARAAAEVGLLQQGLGPVAVEGKDSYVAALEARAVEWALRG